MTTENTLESFTLVPRLLPAFIPPAAWEALPTYRTTVLEVESDVDGGNFEVITDEKRRARQEACFERMANGEPPPDGAVRVRRVVLCHFLAMRVNKADPDDADCAAFGKVITNLLEEKLLLGKLMEPCYIRLATRWPLEEVTLEYANLKGLTNTTVLPNGHVQTWEERPPSCVLLCYVHADMTREQLNEKVGFEAFQLEGSLPANEWGSHVLQQIRPPRTA